MEEENVKILKELERAVENSATDKHVLSEHQLVIEDLRG